MFHDASTSDQELLAEWRWLTGGLPRLVGWSTAGDLFLLDERGQVLLLDPGAGTIEVCGKSLAQFHDELAREDRADDLLQLPVVREYEQAHGLLKPRHCLSFTQLPVFGGAYTAENRYPLPIDQHAGMTGDVHRQIRDLPDGASIKLRTRP